MEAWVDEGALMSPDELEESQLAEAAWFPPEREASVALQPGHNLVGVLGEEPDFDEDAADLEEALREALLQDHPDATPEEIDELLFDALAPVPMQFSTWGYLPSLTKTSGAEALAARVTTARSAGEPEASAPIHPQARVTGAAVPSRAGEAGTASESTFSQAGTDIYVVNGVVTSPGSASVGGLPLRLVDKNVGPDVVLAKGRTGATGEFAFRIQIPSKILEERRKTSPDLQVQVVHNETVVAASIVRYNASTEETLDVDLPPDVDVLQSEYETLTADIALHYTGSLSKLREDDERQDLTYLANKSGWDARAIAMASLAVQFSQHRPAGQTPPVAAKGAGQPGTAQGSGIHPAFYYALFRAGLAADADAVYRTSPSVLQQIWQHAAAQGVMPKELTGQTGHALEHIQSMAVGRALTAPPPVGNSTLGELLQVTLGSDTGRQQQFADLYVRHQDDHDALWREAERIFGADTAARLRLDGQLAYLSVNNAPLVAAVHRDLAERQAPLTSAVNLVSHGYYHAQAWSGLLGGIDAPAQVAGSSRRSRSRITRSCSRPTSGSAPPRQ